MLHRKDYSPLIRCDRNPIITPDDMPVECTAVFNCGVTRFKSKFLLLLRVEDLARRTNFHIATSSDGIHFDVTPEPINYPLRDVEANPRFLSQRFDMRITFLEENYYVCHANWLEPLGSTIGIAKTNDFINFEPIGELSVPSNRNAVLFPERIGNLYARLERPQNINGSGTTWISYSPDLLFWGQAKPLNMPQLAWATRKNGPSTVPIRTSQGWLELYHGTCPTASTENYHCGVMLLDYKDPSKVILAPEKYLLGPKELYECMGQVPNAVFVSGAVETEDGKLYVYYGAADTCVCLAITTVDELLDFCMRYGKTL